MKKLIKKVVVIGGGIAGLGAVQKLLQAGVSNILLVEATNRLGGRVNTVFKKNCKAVELGAQWIHGEVGNDVYQLAKENNLLNNGAVDKNWIGSSEKDDETGSIANVTDNIEYSLSDGARIDMSLVRKIFQKFDELYHETKNVNFKGSEGGQCSKTDNGESLKVKDEYITNENLTKLTGNSCSDGSLGWYLETNFGAYLEKERLKGGSDMNENATFKSGKEVESKKPGKSGGVDETLQRGLFKWKMGNESACKTMAEISLPTYENEVCEGKWEGDWGETGYRGLVDCLIESIRSKSSCHGGGCDSRSGLETDSSSKEESLDCCDLGEFEGKKDWSCDHVRLNCEVEEMVWSGRGCGCEDCKRKDEGDGNGNIIVPSNKNYPTYLESSGNENQMRSQKGSARGGKKDKVVVRLKSGEEIETEHVIITVSLGVLKDKLALADDVAGKEGGGGGRGVKEDEGVDGIKVLEDDQRNIDPSFFSPQLPTCKLESIKNLGFVTLNKIHLEFEKAFWSNDVGGYNLVWKEGEVMEMESLKKRGRSLQDTEWVKKISSLMVCSRVPNLLTGWISGREAVMMEGEDDDFVVEVIVELLEKFVILKKAPRVSRMIRSKWGTDKFFKGSCTYHRSSTSSQHSASLSTPVPSSQDPQLLFAGEATHKHFFSTTHGALNSGWKQALVLIKHFEGNKRNF